MATITTGPTVLNDAMPRVEVTGWILKMLGSLKFTVGLFALSLILVLVGTLAQDEMNMQEVKQRYFVSWIAMLHFDDFFPQAFLSHERRIPGVLPIPGGASIGVMLLINLLAAKVTRFKVHAGGGRLGAGIVLILVGVLVGGLIVASGHNSDGLQGTPPISYASMWSVILSGLAMSAVGCVAIAVNMSSLPARIAAILTAIALLAVVGVCLSTGYRIGDPGLRIVWQLTKGVGAGLILLAGCQLIFGKQGGNVLLHLGVGLLMVGQFSFGDRQTEQRLTLMENQSTNAFVNLDKIELTFLQDAQAAQRVVAIPASRLAAAAQSDTLIDDPVLPVKLRVLDYYANSTLTQVKPSGPRNELADRGIGLEVVATRRDPFGGATPKTNLPAVYLEVLDRDKDQSLGKFLVSQQLTDPALFNPDDTRPPLMDEIRVGDDAYSMALRYHREVKPYWVQLEDVQRITYSGTSTPRDYSSNIRIIDPETGDDIKARVWMNNPLRYRGETFYQSSYDTLANGKELTGIQVVRNSGWLVPYVACSIIALGMAAHFWGTLTRFVRRRQREAKQAEDLAGRDNPFAARTTIDAAAGNPRRRAYALPLTVGAVALFALTSLVPRTWLGDRLRPAQRDMAYDLYTMGRLPVQSGGRVMPLDAYARQTLKAISNRESLKLMYPADEEPVTVNAALKPIRDRVGGDTLSALHWLMEVATDAEAIRYLPMFRIDAEEVRAELGLQRKPSKLYSLEEISANYERAAKIVAAAMPKAAGDRSFQEKKLIELDLRTREFTMAAAAFRMPVPETIPDEVIPEGVSRQEVELFAFRRLQERIESLAQMSAPGIAAPGRDVVASTVDQPRWDAFAVAFFENAKERLMKSQDAANADRPGVDTFAAMLKAYSADQPSAFNAAVDRHLAATSGYAIPGYNPTAVAVERWMNATHPESVATAIYILAIVLGLAFFATGSQPLRRIVWSSLLIAFAIHTVVLIARIYITGRAPVINLYSSAVFVGWAAVLFGLSIERIYRYGTGNMMAAMAGMLTLRVAYGLTLNVGQGDTMPVLQAVLDTQFWLSTHVISVSLGYVATMVAGLLGILYLIAGWTGRGPKIMRDLYGSVYGATCFGILFSTIGTILGGLWADDSWGRFWGWDPKENGALLIVIWNALMLHARWDKLVGGRGFSMLAIGGNIVTAWSWFGTNELGIGLHSYGFTEGTMRWLTIFFATQLMFIMAGAIFWRSATPHSDPDATA